MQHVEKHAEDFERRVEILTDIGLVTVNANPADVCARGGKNTNDLGIIYIIYYGKIKSSNNVPAGGQVTTSSQNTGIPDMNSFSNIFSSTFLISNLATIKVWGKNHAKMIQHWLKRCMGLVIMVFSYIVLMMVLTGTLIIFHGEPLVQIQASNFCCMRDHFQL